LKIIVTGGAGFIGSHLAIRLIQERHQVYIIDNLHPYYSPDRKRRQLKFIDSFGSFVYINQDLLDRDKVMAIFKEVSPEVVIHLAALPGVAYSIEEPLKYVDYDVKATINVLEAAGESGVAQVVFASSSSVYGNQPGPFKEEMANGRVISPYAASKYSAESFCHVYENLYGFQMKILRFFTVYGPWGRPDMAIGRFIHKLLKGESISIFGEGRARDFTYVEDIVNGIYLTVTKLENSEILNIGSGRPITIAELIAELGIYFPDMRLKKENSRAGDVMITLADIGKAQKLIGYNPSTDFASGLKATVNWAREYEKLL
jgi:UDP-glucuronate 4-epimerase